MREIFARLINDSCTEVSLSLARSLKWGVQWMSMRKKSRCSVGGKHRNLIWFHFWRAALLEREMKTNRGCRGQVMHWTVQFSAENKIKLEKIMPCSSHLVDKHPFCSDCCSRGSLWNVPLHWIYQAKNRREILFDYLSFSDYLLCASLSPPVAPWRKLHSKWMPIWQDSENIYQAMSRWNIPAEE